MIDLSDWLGSARGLAELPVRNTAEVAFRRDETWRLPEPLPAHVGLWLDRCLPAVTLTEPRPFRPDTPTKEKWGRQALYAAAIAALDPSRSPPALQAYRPIAAAYLTHSKRQPENATRWWTEMETTSRLLLHPAVQETVTDGSILLHHTYGVPYIPGSALAGVCRTAAQRQSNAGVNPLDDPKVDWVRLLFGNAPDDNESCGGILRFEDALWLPGDRSPLAFDVVTPHHSDYYTRKSDRPFPDETDAPIPTQRLTVAPGTRFLIVVETIKDPAAEKWLKWVCNHLLMPALAHDGVGSRTSNGYGRLERLGMPTPRPGASRTPPRSSRSPDSSPAAPAGGRDLAHVTFVANTGMLHATLPDGTRATVQPPTAHAIRKTLSESSQKRLKKGKTLRMYVRWTPRGNAKEIEGLDEG